VASSDLSGFLFKNVGHPAIVVTFWGDETAIGRVCAIGIGLTAGDALTGGGCTAGVGTTGGGCTAGVGMTGGGAGAGAARTLEVHTRAKSNMHPMVNVTPLFNSESEHTLSPFDLHMLFAWRKVFPLWQPYRFIRIFLPPAQQRTASLALALSSLWGCFLPNEAGHPAIVVTRGCPASTTAICAFASAILLSKSVLQLQMSLDSSPWAVICK